MFNKFYDEDFVQYKISSEFENIEKIIQDVKIFLKKYSIKDHNPLTLVIRELIINAIEHGNRNNNDLKVFASVENLGYRRFKIVVEDEGDGFDYKNITQSGRIQKKGLDIVLSISDKLDFNKKGNCATAFILICSEKEFKVKSVKEKDGSEYKLIRPSSNIKYENAEKFRMLLLDLFQKNFSRYSFDLSQVEDIDFVSLSIFIKFANMIIKKFPDANLEIINANHDIKNLMRLTNLDKVYSVSS